jgi:biopolymer transport protein ExbB/TolQ
MSNPLYNAIFDVAKVLEIPVVVLALVALAVVVIEVGALLPELNTRRRRRSGTDKPVLTDAAVAARRALRAGSPAQAVQALRPIAWSAAMDETYAAFVAHIGQPGSDSRLAKDLADFDFGRQRRLGRTRLLVRMGPALGLMGTLIPLSPALDGLAKGNVGALTENLRVAFSITVLGLFIGAIAFGLSLIRERLYGQDYSDLEYVASVLTDDDPAFDRPATEAKTTPS